MSDDFITTVLFLAVLWLIASSVAVAYAARKRRGNFAAWFFASLLLSPFLAMLLLIADRIPVANREDSETSEDRVTHSTISISPR